MLSKIKNIENHLYQALLFLAGASLVFMMFLGFADVFARYFFKSSFVQREELFRVGLIIVFVCTFPVISFKREHLSVDLLDNLFIRFWRSIQQLLVDASVAISSGVMAYWMWDKSERISRKGREVMFEELGLQQGYFAKVFAIILACVCVVLMVSILIKTYQLFIQYAGKRKGVK